MSRYIKLKHCNLALLRDWWVMLRKKERITRSPPGSQQTLEAQSRPLGTQAPALNLFMLRRAQDSLFLVAKYMSRWGFPY